MAKWAVYVGQPTSAGIQRGIVSINIQEHIHYSQTCSCKSKRAGEL